MIKKMDGDIFLTGDRVRVVDVYLEDQDFIKDGDTGIVFDCSKYNPYMYFVKLDKKKNGIRLRDDGTYPLYGMQLEKIN